MGRAQAHTLIIQQPLHFLTRKRSVAEESSVCDDFSALWSTCSTVCLALRTSVHRSGCTKVSASVRWGALLHLDLALAFLFNANDQLTLVWSHSHSAVYCLVLLNFKYKRSAGAYEGGDTDEVINTGTNCVCWCPACALPTSVATC